MATQKEINSVENEIGNLGGTSSSVLNKKIPYANEILGIKDNLSSDEKQDMDDFISKTSFRKKKKEKEEISISSGWLPLDKEEMGLRSIFYPQNWTFYIKAATVNAIKNWTSIDESKIDQINNALTDIIRTCVKIDTGSTFSAGWKDINSWDRFWFILKVKELSFNSGENEIKYDDVCPECNEPITYVLNSRSLNYEFPDQDLIDKYWTGTCWEIDPSEYGVSDYQPVKLYTPTLGKDDMIIQWATQKAQNNQKIDESFINYLTWMLNKPSNSLQNFDVQVSRIKKEYFNWNLDMFNFMTDVIKNLSVNQSEKLTMKCPNCSMEVSSTVQFPDGVKSLFVIENKNIKKFGSR